jgi:hypothetical protein
MVIPGNGVLPENEVVFWDEYFTYHWFMDFIRDEFQVDILWKFVKELRRFSFFSEPRDKHQLAKCLARAALNGDMRVLRFGRDLHGRRDWNDPDYTPMVGIFLPVKPKEPKPEPPVRKVEDPYGPIRIRVVEDSTGKPIPNVKISFFLDGLPSIYTNAKGIAETANVLGRTYVAECRLGKLLSHAQVLDYVGEGETPICPSEESSEPDNATEEASGSSSSPPEFIIAHVKGNKRIKWEMEGVHINKMRTVRVRKPSHEPIIAIEGPDVIIAGKSAIYTAKNQHQESVVVYWTVEISDSKVESIACQGDDRFVISGNQLTIKSVPGQWCNRTIRVAGFAKTTTKRPAFRLSSVKWEPKVIADSWSVPDPSGRLEAHRPGVGRDFAYGDFSEQQYRAMGRIFDLDYSLEARLGTNSNNQPVGLVGLGHQPDNQLFDAFREMAQTFFTAGDLVENTDAMIDHFQSNSGLPYSNETLTAKVKEHDSTRRFVSRLSKLLMFKMNDVGFDAGKLSARSIGRFATPKFGSWIDKAKGLTIAVHDTWAYEIELIDYELTEAAHCFKLKITFFDHFGLDPHDMQSPPVMALAGFRAWFILQRVRRYKPFITKMAFEETLEIPR